MLFTLTLGWGWIYESKLASQNTPYGGVRRMKPSLPCPCPGGVEQGHHISRTSPVMEGVE